jgi:hypothetical protein
MPDIVLCTDKLGESASGSEAQEAAVATPAASGKFVAEPL